MQFKRHIALLLVFIFLGKMLTVDAKFLGSLLNSTGVTLVNKNCHKKSLLSGNSDEVSTPDSRQVLKMDLLCHSAFDHSIAEWLAPPIEDNFLKYKYQTPGIFPTPPEKFYPPPKV